MVTKEEISTRMGTARREGEAKANKKFAARDKKEPTGVAGGSSYAGPALGY